MCVSYGVPATRMGYLKTATLDWTVSFEKIGTCGRVLATSPCFFICIFVVLRAVPPGKPEVHGYGEMGAAPHHYVYACTKPSQAR